MVDTGQILKSATQSGKVFYGSREALNAARLGRAVAIVVADGCPRHIREEVEKVSRLSSIPVFSFKGTSRELGTACRRPFGISVLAVREIPETDLALAVKESMQSSASSQT